MPMRRFVIHNPWILLLFWGMITGVCLFQYFGVTKAHAVEPNSPIFAQSQTPTTGKEMPTQPLALPEESPNPSPGFFPTLFRLILALALIVGLIIAVVWFLKTVWEKWGWNNRTEEGKPIRVLTSSYLAPRKAIHLVEVGNRILIVGTGNDEMSCLDVIVDPNEVETLRQAAQPGFSYVFNRVQQQHESVQRMDDTKKIIEESNQIVGGYMEKLKNISKKKDRNRDGK